MGLHRCPTMPPETCLVHLDGSGETNVEGWHIDRDDELYELVKACPWCGESSGVLDVIAPSDDDDD